MQNIKIISPPLPHIPWQEKPSDCNNPMWRYSRNPVIPRDLLFESNSIFNSAVVPFKNGFAGVFRCDDTSRRMNIHCGFSGDGLTWKIDSKPIEFIDKSGILPESEYKYDPRVVYIDDKYYVTWCNGYHGPCIGAGWTNDFEKFHTLENFLMPYNRNGVLFPRKINGNYAILSRPSDTGHTKFGDVFYSESPDMTYWGKHRHVMGTRSSESAWQSTKIGAGPVPIETTEGWLLFYHGVLNSCNGFVYSMGAAILDVNQPWKVKYRTRPYLLSPQKLYECVGDVPNVVFPCAALTDSETGRIAVYYGAADTVTAVAFTEINGLFDFIKNNSL